MIKDYFKFAFRTFKVRGVRTFLTILGIFIAIAAIVSLISLGQGLQQAIGEQFEKMGTNKIILSPAGTFFGMTGEAAVDLTEDDLEVIKKVQGVKYAGGMLYKLAKVKFKEEGKYTWVIGLPLDESRRIIEEIGSFDYVSGRELKEGDKYNLAMGISFVEDEFFTQPVGVGDKLEIEGKKFKVVGGIGRIGNPQDDSQVYLPLETAREVLKEPKKLDFIMVETVKGASPTGIAEEIKKELREFRKVKEGEEDFNIQTFEELMSSYASILTIVQAVLIGLAAISLLVGGVGIMNTMYTSVLERTNEIGVMKAIGAKNRDILTIFLVESGFLGLMGGVIGVLIGVGLGKVVELVALQQGLGILKVYFPWYLIVGALLFSFLVGCLSGLAPAWRASKLNPVESLRYE